MLNPIFCWGLQFLASPVAKLGLMENLAKAMGKNVLASVDGKLSVAEWVERTRELSPRSGDTIMIDDVVVVVRKVRRTRVAEIVIHPVSRQS